jgi:RimJ/RimL family protein N-acetyltransferase
MRIPSIGTPRLLLREYTPDDLDERAQLFHGHPGTDEDRDWLAYHLCLYECGDGLGYLAVILKESGAMTGEVGLEAHLNPLAEGSGAPWRRSVDVELSYRFGQVYWGRGYATEACQALLNYAFEQLQVERVVAATDKDNARSLKLLRRLAATGFIDVPPHMVYAILENPSARRPAGPAA